MNMTKETFRRVRSWILRNGRSLEAARFAFHFGGGSAEDVAGLLALYQNPDGGFGLTLEPDSWNPHSSPYTTSNALGVLREIGVTDHPICQGILRYLSSGDGFVDGLWQFAIPSNDEHPHAPWWSFSPEANAQEGLGLSAVLAAFVLDAEAPDAPLYQASLEIARRALGQLMTGDRHGTMGIDGYMALRHCWEGLSMADIDAVDARLCALVNETIVRDPALWEQYVPRPSAVISTPESPFYAGNEAAIEAELDYLLSTLPRDDVWPINWCWFDLQERYANAFAVSERWWKASRAVDALRLLKAFGRIEGESRRRQQ